MISDSMVSDSIDLGEMILTGPPRSVPLLVRCRLLFGGFINQFGWFFFGFGMIFFWVFALNTDPTAWPDFRGPLETVPGHVTRCEKTNASEGGGEHSDGTPIYRHDYEFHAGDEVHAGTSYAVGTQHQPGTSVTVEFPAGRPERSRISGMRTAIFAPWALIVVIFPIAGLCFIAAGLRKGRKAVHLLAHGRQAFGGLASREPTNTRINKQTVYKLTFEFTDDLGETRTAVARTHEPDLLQDDVREPLLYDPADPDDSTLLDHLPGSPRIDEAGTIRTGVAWRSIGAMLLPAVSIVGHGVYAYVRIAGS